MEIRERREQLAHAVEKREEQRREACGGGDWEDGKRAWRPGIYRAVLGFDQGMGRRPRHGRPVNLGVRVVTTRRTSSGSWLGFLGRPTLAGGVRAQGREAHVRKPRRRLSRRGVGRRRSQREEEDKASRWGPRVSDRKEREGRAGGELGRLACWPAGSTGQGLLAVGLHVRG